MDGLEAIDDIRRLPPSSSSTVPNAQLLDEQGRVRERRYKPTTVGEVVWRELEGYGRADRKRRVSQNRLNARARAAAFQTLPNDDHDEL